jgi:predicted nucleic acid-binding protein
VRLFLDASVLLAAAGSSTGASREIFSYASEQNWSLVSSPYALNEVLRNLAKLPGNATTDWLRLRLQLVVVDDVVSLDKPVVFAASKDRPILFTALAWSTVLLTLDKADFADVLGGRFYGLDVLLPYDLLERERAAGRLIDRAGSNS